jgi:hypothetical protein
MSGRVPVPVEVDDVDAAWLSLALGRHVARAEVIDRSSGTTGRLRIALEGAPGLPATVFVKLAPFDEEQRGFVDMTGMGPAEARFYRDLASDVPVRVPATLFADTDDGRYIMVLEDLTATGCRFPSPNDADIEQRSRDVVAQLAELHAAYWESDRFAPGNDLDWLTARGVSEGGGGRWLIEQSVKVLGDQMDETFHRIASIYIARSEDIGALWSSGPGTLIHGDAPRQPLRRSRRRRPHRLPRLGGAVPRAGDPRRRLRAVRVGADGGAGAHRARLRRGLVRAPGRSRDRGRSRRGVGPVPDLRGLLVGRGRRNCGDGLEVAADRDRPELHPARQRRARAPRQRRPARVTARLRKVQA